MSDQHPKPPSKEDKVSKFTGLINRQRAPAEPIRKARDQEYFGTTFDRQGMHPVSAAIDFHLSSGDSFGVFYYAILSPILFNRGQGASPQKIRLKTQTLEITIQGRNLYSVYEYLLEQRLVWVKEADSSFVPDEEGKTVIEQISFEERD